MGLRNVREPLPSVSGSRQRQVLFRSSAAAAKRPDATEKAKPWAPPSEKSSSFAPRRSMHTEVHELKGRAKLLHCSDLWREPKTTAGRIFQAPRDLRVYAGLHQLHRHLEETIANRNFASVSGGESRDTSQVSSIVTQRPWTTSIKAPSSAPGGTRSP